MRRYSGLLWGMVTYVQHVYWYEIELHTITKPQDKQWHEAKRSSLVHSKSSFPRWSGSGSVFWEPSDHDASKDLMNPCPEWIHDSFDTTWFKSNDHLSLILKGIHSKKLHSTVQQTQISDFISRSVLQAIKTMENSETAIPGHGHRHL